MVVPPTSQGGLFRATLEAVPDAVVVADQRGVIVVANGQVEPVFGYTPGELEGRSVEILVPAAARANHPALRQGYGRRPMGLLPLAAVRKDGSEFPAEISLAPILDVEQTLTVATIRDVTERLRLEREAERMRDDLLATVTHELRTPLTSIIGNVELMGDLDESELGPQARRFLHVIGRNAERELRLVTDLLTMAVDSLDRPSVELVPVDVGELVRETVRLRHSAARERALRLAADVGDAPLVVLGDGHRLTQVLDNLVNNATKFTRPGGSITLRVRRFDGQVAVSCTDTGVGMDEHDRERVFERLYRASSAVRSETPGAGLGLAISKAIVEAHHGTIGIESEIGRGTTVTVLLPAAP